MHISSGVISGSERILVNAKVGFLKACCSYHRYQRQADVKREILPSAALLANYVRVLYLIYFILFILL